MSRNSIKSSKLALTESSTKPTTQINKQRSSDNNTSFKDDDDDDFIDHESVGTAQLRIKKIPRNKNIQKDLENYHKFNEDLSAKENEICNKAAEYHKAVKEKENVKEIKKEFQTIIKNIKDFAKEYIHESPLFKIGNNITPIYSAIYYKDTNKIWWPSQFEIVLFDPSSKNMQTVLNFEKKVRIMTHFHDKTNSYLAVFGENLAEIYNLKAPDYCDWQKTKETIKLDQGENIMSADFSPDGNHLMMGYEEGNINIYDILKKNFFMTMREHKNAVLAVAFSPNKSFAASGGLDEIVNLYSVSKYTVLYRFTSLGGEINSICFSPESDLIAFTGKMEKVSVHKTTHHTGFKKIQTIETNKKNSKIAFFKKEKETFLMVGKNGEIALYKNLLDKMEPIYHKIGEEKDKVVMISISSYQEKIGLFVTKKIEDNKFSINDFDYDKTRENKFQHNEISVPMKSQKLWALAVSPLNNLIATGGQDGYVRLFDIDNGKPVLWRKLYKGVDKDKKASPINCLNFSCSGTKIVTGSTDGSINILNLMGQTLASLDNSTAVKSIMFTPSDKRIICGSEKKKNGCLLIYEIDYSKSTENYKTVYLNDVHKKDEQILGLDYAFDDSKFVSASADKAVLLHKVKNLDGNTPAYTETEKIITHENTARAVSFSPDGIYLLSGGYDSKIFLYNLETKDKRKFCFLEEGEIRFVSFWPGLPNKALSAFSDGQIFFFSIPEGKVLFKIKVLPEDEYLRGAVFSRDGTRLITASEKGYFQIHDITQEEKVIKYSGHKDLVRAVTISPTGDKYATGGDDKEVKIYDFKTNIEVRRIPQEDWVNCIAFSPDGTKILVSGGSVEVKLYDIFSGSQLQKYVGPSEWIPAAAFSPNQSYVVSGSTDKLLRIYKTRSGVMLASYPSMNEKEEEYNNTNLTEKRNLKQTYFETDQSNLNQKANNDDRNLFKLGSIFAVAFTYDSKSILIGNDENENFLSKLDLSTKTLKKLEGHSQAVRAIKSFNNEPFFASGDDGGMIIIFSSINDNIISKFEGDEIAINSISISLTNKTLATGSDESLIQIFDIKSKESSKEIIPKPNENISKGNVYSVALFSDERLLFSKKNKARCRYIKEKEGVNEPCYANKSSCIEFDQSGGFFAICGKHIDIFDFKTGLIYKRLDFEKWLTSIKENESEKHSNKVENKLEKKHSAQKFDDENGSIHDEKKSQDNNKIIFSVQKIKFSSDGDQSENKDFILVLTKNSDIILINIKENTEDDTNKKLISNNSKQNIENKGQEQLTTINFFKDSKGILIGDSMGKIHKITFEVSLSAFLKDEKASPNITEIAKPHESNVLEIYHIKKINKKTKMTENYLLSGSVDGSISLIKLYSEKKYERVYNFNPHKETLNSLRLSYDTKRFVSASSDKTIKVFETFSGSEIKKLNNESKVLCADFTKTRDFIFAIDDKSLITFDINTGLEFDRLKATSNEAYKTLAVHTSCDSVILGSNVGPQFFYKVLNTSQRLNRFNFDEVPGKKDDEDKNLEHWKAFYDKYENFDFDINDLYLLPYPIKFNKVHHMIMELGAEKSLDRVYLYYTKGIIDSPGYIENCLLSRDSFNLTPWKYWLDSMNDESSDKMKGDKKDNILKKLIEIFLFKKLPNLENMAQKALIIEKIALEIPQEISKGFEFFTTKKRGVDLPISEYFTESLIKESKYCYFSEISIKSIIEMENPNTDNAINDEKSSTEESIKRMKPKFAVSFCLVRPKDLTKHLNVFSSLPLSHPIYKSQPFLDLIEHRWKVNGYSLFFRDAVIYICLLSIISVNCLVFYPFRMSSKIHKYTYQMLSFSLDILIILVLILFYARNEYIEIKNIYQFGLWKKLKIHFSSFWNYLDLGVIVFGLTFSSFDILEIWIDIGYSGQVALKIMCAVFFFISWIRFLDFARGFDTSSTLVRVIVQVIKDMKGFFLGLFFLLIGVSLTTYLLQSDYQARSHWEFVAIFYDILIGDYSAFKSIDNLIFSELLFGILILTTISSVFIMLTLLISIISDSFNKVIALEKEAGAYEKIQSIYERSYKLGDTEENMNYIYTVRSDLSEGDNEDKANKKKILKLDQQATDIKKSLNNLEKNIKEQYLAITSKLIEIEKKCEKSNANDQLGRPKLDN